MPLLLIDERDGRVLAELNEAEALAVLEAKARAGTVPEYLSVVDCRSTHGSLVGTDTSIKIGTLS